MQIPHDRAIKTFPFPELPISVKTRELYESLRTNKILGKLEQRQFPSDIPFFYVYACERPSGKNKVNVSHGSGGSEDEAEAISCAIFEAIEHYCILHERKDLFIKGRFSELKVNAIDPVRFEAFSKAQLPIKKNREFVINSEKPLNWLRGYSLTKKRKVLIPASLAYASYNFKEYSEPTIRKPISTGAACGPTTFFAISRGLCEIIERDSYMISFLPEMPKKLLIINERDGNVFNFINRFKKYGLELYFIDTTLDTGVFSVVSILVDRTGCGPAVCAGLGSSLEPVHAIETSAIEALRGYATSRELYFQEKNVRPPKKHSFDWFSWKKHLIWSSPHMIKEVEKIITSSKKVTLPKPKLFKTDREKVSYLTEKLDKLGCEVIYVDMTIPEIEKFGLKVIKVLCPEMVPLWHDGRYPYLGVRRLWEVPRKYGIDVNLDLDEKELIGLYPF